MQDYAEKIQKADKFIGHFNKKLEQGRGRLSLLRDQHGKKERELKESMDIVSAWALIQKLLTASSEVARQQMVETIEGVVTAALKNILAGKEVEFRIHLDERGGQPSATWKVVTIKDGAEYEEDPEEDRGGGLVDVVSISLRLAIREILGSKGFLVSDEPGKMLSGDHAGGNYSQNTAQFLQEHAEKADCQHIMITHNKDIMCNAAKSYYVEQDENEISSAREMEVVKA